MKTKTKYVSDSGREYDTPEAALKNDTLFAAQNEVNRLLPQAVDKNCDYANGGGYVQHVASDMNAFKAGIERLLSLEFGEGSDCLKFWREGCEWAGRYLSDSGSDTYRLWTRWYCTDGRLREWGQGFYMLHPEAGKQVPWPEVERAGLRYFGR